MKHPSATRDDEPYIYIATPWTPSGGGMYKVSEYLIQSQAPLPPDQAARLRPLDSRGGASPLFSLWIVFIALTKIVRGRIEGRLAGVHVNVAERLSLIRKGLIILTSRALGVPVVAHLHAHMKDFYDALPGPLQGLTRWIFSLANCVLVIGPQARRFVIDELRVPAERVEIVINGVPPATVPRRPSEPGRVLRVLFVGRLSRLKGVDDLLDALARPGFDRSRLQATIAGCGDVAAYQARARELGIHDFVRIPGWCSQDDVAQLLAQTDVLVLPSYVEVLPLAVLEALANGVAVVCTPVGEIPSLLSDGVDVVFVQPGDTAGLAAKLQQVLGHPELLERLERNGHALYERQFSMARFFHCVARVHQRTFGVAGHALEAGARGAQAKQ
jgi:glycosyltransferase involved in cell wall biosynthesis